ncbi:CbtA family protein [Gandjariella thermophila]|uniref:CbtA family protein n=1 Tax=Gandjariella thermophila TaxID=1931992 RepID=UPI0027D96133|nr:CbtA family protein [Gandjariella thermophila]
MLLVRGMLSGLVAGLLALVFARIFGEPSVGAAIDFESAEQAARGETPDPELVSRGVQSTLGLATGVLVYAVAFGGLFALAFAVAYGRVGRLSPRATALLVALGGYLAAFVVPFLKYPANPPSIGNPDTINERTVVYFGMVALSIALAVAATYLGRRLVSRLGAWNAALVAGAAFIVTAALGALLLPTVNEVPEGFPAGVLWNFRVASLGIQLVMWTTMGLLFGALVHRRLAASGRAPEQAAPGAVAPVH